MDSRQRAELVHRGDLDELVRAVDAAASRGDHDEVWALRTACMRAVEETGRQLWGPAAYAAYRVALDGPVDLAVDAVVGGHDRHTLGPLTEVVAQHHSFAALADQLPPGPLRGVVAVERVARGEDLRDDDRAEVSHLDVPATWQPWEGPAPVVDYRAQEVLAPAPVPQPLADWRVSTSVPAPELGDVVLEEALEAIIMPWAEQSTAEVVVLVGDGPAEAAVAALVPGRPRVREITMASAVAWMTWAGASGGAVGRRRGVAAGRSATWWLLRCLLDDQADDLHDPDELEYHLADCRFLEFSTGIDTGWRLQLAIEHADGPTVAVDAVDKSPEPDESR